MNVELITREDLREFKNELLNELKQIMQPGQGQSWMSMAISVTNHLFTQQKGAWFIGRIILKKIIEAALRALPTATQPDN